MKIIINLNEMLLFIKIGIYKLNNYKFYDRIQLKIRNGGVTYDVHFDLQINNQKIKKKYKHLFG